MGPAAHLIFYVPLELHLCLAPQVTTNIFDFQVTFFVENNAGGIWALSCYHDWQNPHGHICNAKWGLRIFVLVTLKDTNVNLAKQLEKTVVDMVLNVSYILRVKDRQDCSFVVKSAKVNT